MAALRQALYLMIQRAGCDCKKSEPMGKTYAQPLIWCAAANVKIDVVRMSPTAYRKVMTVTLVSFAFFFGMLISRIGLPPMVGFLVAGFAYNFAGFETPDSLQTIADLGVTLLLFSIGLKLKVKDLATAEVWGTSVAHILASTLFFSLVIILGKYLFPHHCLICHPSRRWFWPLACRFPAPFLPSKFSKIKAI